LISLEGGSKKDDQFKKARNEEVTRNGDNENYRNRKSCCCCFSVKTGFKLYGIIDLIILILIIVTLGAGVAKKSEVKDFFITILVSYIPNVLIFFIILCVDTSKVRKVYLYFLNFKLFIAAFMLPGIIVRSITSG